MRFSNSNVLPTSFDCNGCVIGQRTQSDRTADGIRSGGERKPIGWRTQSDWVAGAFKGVHLSQVHQQSKQVPNKTVKCTNFLSVVNILAWLVHLRQVHPLKKTLRNRNNIAAGHTVMSSGYTLLYIGGFKGVHLRYFNIARLVHFLLWQAAKPSGDKCTP